MNFEEILFQVGEFGKYQKLILWLILLPAVFPCGFHAYNQLFMASKAKHWCKLPKFNHLDEDVIKNLSIPLNLIDGKWEFNECLMYDRNYTQLDSFSMKNYENFSTSLNWSSITAQISCKDGWIYKPNDRKTIVTEWNLVCEKDFLTTIALVLFGIGGLIGNYIFGYLQDGLGRKLSFYIYLFIQCAFGMATTFATNFYVWCFLRVGVGFTIPAILATPCVLAIELVGSHYRTKVAVLINIAYSLSLITLAVIVWIIRDWRLLAFATTAPFLLLFTCYRYFPESPRWLLSKGKFNELEKILKTMAKVNGKTYRESYICDLKQNYIEKVVTNSSRKYYGVSDLFKNSNLKFKTIIITFIWFINTSVYVGLSYYAPVLGGDQFLNFFLAGVVELPTYLFLSPCMERLGRRWTLCISMVLGGSACLATFLVKNDMMITLCLFCFGKMGISSAFVVVPLMASELYPTVVRGLGMSFSSVIGMFGPVFIPLINYLGTDMLTMPLIIMGSLLVVGGMCSLLLPETLNRDLPQTLEDDEALPPSNYTKYCICLK